MVTQTQHEIVEHGQEQVGIVKVIKIAVDPVFEHIDHFELDWLLVFTFVALLQFHRVHVQIVWIQIGHTEALHEQIEEFDGRAEFPIANQEDARKVRVQVQMVCETFDELVDCGRLD